MKKITLLSALLLLLMSCKNGNRNRYNNMAAFNAADNTFTNSIDKRPFGNYFYFEGYFFNNRLRVWQPINYLTPDNEVYRVFDIVKLTDKQRLDSLRKANPNTLYKQSAFKSPMLLGVKLNPSLTNFLTYGSRPDVKRDTRYQISDTSAATVVAMGIDDKNVKNIRYHVLEDGSRETLAWTTPPLQQQFGAKKPYAFLGKFKAPGKMITVEVYNTQDAKVIDKVILDWRASIKPQISQILINTGQDSVDVTIPQNNRFASSFDPKTKMPRNLAFREREVTDLDIVFKEHPSVLYTIYLIKNVYGRPDTTQIANNVSENKYYLNHKYFDLPGNYHLLIQPVNFWDNIQTTRLDFRVMSIPIMRRQYAVKQIARYAMVVLLLIGVGFAIYYRYNQQKLGKAAQQKAMANLQLKSIRSQLNPHFMFNALSAIQNLMNQQDIEGANHYLAKFAGLTRKVLHSGGQEMISLEDEVAILDDYLQMEQLRFGFSFNIQVDETINRANTEIPAMLLQPFVENAVKHGVSALQKDGIIDIAVKRQVHDIVLTVSDNGPGFDVNNGATYQTGFGLKLSRERITLLNQVYGNRATLQINSVQGNTTITVRLTGWV